VTDIDNRWPKLEQAQGLQVDVIIAHQQMTGLAISCGPFFDWMTKHDHHDPRIVWTLDGTEFIIDGDTYPLVPAPAAGS
jgi:hypothetical protein